MCFFIVIFGYGLRSIIKFCDEILPCIDDELYRIVGIFSSNITDFLVANVLVNTTWTNKIDIYILASKYNIVLSYDWHMLWIVEYPVCGNFPNVFNTLKVSTKHIVERSLYNMILVSCSRAVWWMVSALNNPLTCHLLDQISRLK